MAFDGGRQLEDGIAVEPTLLRERGSGGDARHDGFGGRPHAARLRDVVVRFEDEPDLAQAKGLACLAERGDDQMGLVARQRVLALAIDQHLRGAIGRVTAEREPLCSIALGRPTVSTLAVLGEISISGTILKVDELANSLQVCLDSGAKKVLLPISSAVDLGTVPPELVGSFNLIFYSSAEDAVFKALGVE